MSYRRLGAAAGCALALLAGCDEAPTAAVEPVSRPVRTALAEAAPGNDLRHFPGQLRAIRQAELAFRVPGQLREINIREGDLVAAGEVIASLDPTDYQTALADRQASYNNAARNFRRAEELVDSGSISRLDYDRTEAAFRSAEAALEQARNNLSYTELRAPFDGRVAERRVDNFEEVQAKQPVFFLQDTRQLEVVIDLPSAIIRGLGGNRERRVQDAADADAATIRAWATFDDHPGVRLPLAVREMATRADPATQTYRVTLAMAAPDSFTVLPGMTADVAVDFSPLMGREASYWVPAQAVQANASLEPRVWVLDDATMTVQARPVETGRLAGDRIEIVSGLASGEEVVAVGAPYLAEGMPVTRLPRQEQANPRPDDD